VTRADLLAADLSIRQRGVAVPQVELGAVARDGTSARRHSVRTRSTVSTSSSATCPAASRPGHRQIIGMRVMASAQMPGAFSMMPCSVA